MPSAIAVRVRRIADDPHPWIPGADADLIREIADKLELLDDAIVVLNHIMNCSADPQTKIEVEDALTWLT